METNAQVAAVLAELRSLLGDGLLAVYLHGSAVSGELRPQSDIDLLAVVDRPMSAEERAALRASLLRLSGRYPRAPGGPRCLELLVFSQPGLAEGRFPARAEFVYGEWLRDTADADEAAMPERDPEYTLVLAQARREAVALFGPAGDRVLPEISAQAVRQAMRDMLPGLLEGLDGDTGNVLLTLARMWHTASNGTFVSKDEAARWAAPRLAGEDARTMAHARRVYLGEAAGDWPERLEAARRLAGRLARHVTGAMAARG